MIAVLCLPACLCVSTAASRGQAPHLGLVAFPPRHPRQSKSKCLSRAGMASVAPASVSFALDPASPPDAGLDLPIKKCPCLLRRMAYDIHLLQPGLPIITSQPFKCHQSAVQRFSRYRLDAVQAKKGNEPPKRRTCPSHFCECPSPMVPIPFAVAAAPPGCTSEMLKSKTN